MVISVPEVGMPPHQLEAINQLFRPLVPPSQVPAEVTVTLPEVPVFPVPDVAVNVPEAAVPV